MKIKVTKLICKRCSHEWAPRHEDVRMCPACKTPYFDVPQEEQKEEGYEKG